MGRARSWLRRRIAGPGAEAHLHGSELSDISAAHCRTRAPQAQVRVGNALADDFDGWLGTLPSSGQELWVGNPPYNGTSPMLKDKAGYASLRSLLPSSFPLPRGTSLRDDFAFFLLLAAARLTQKEGALAFVTPATLLDSFLYAPMRNALLSTLDLAEVADLGTGCFSNTRVRTCVTVWKSKRPARRIAARYRARHELAPEPRWTPEVSLHPSAPDWSLKPVPEVANRLHERWSQEGVTLPNLFRVHLPGLKTRFEELLVDDDADRLFGRLCEFVRTPTRSLPTFAEVHAIPQRTFSKLI